MRSKLEKENPFQRKLRSGKVSCLKSDERQDRVCPGEQKLNFSSLVCEHASRP